MSLRILVTGSEGYIGQRLMAAFVAEAQVEQVVGLDVRAATAPAYPFYQMDIRSPALAEVIAAHQITHVVHLASILQPSNDPKRDYDIDVNGTRNLLEACVQHAVEHLTITSSGAAYGYHKDNPAWLTEQDPLRGHPKFSYSEHKREIEELLAHYRQRAPQLKQLVLRPGTVLGRTTSNPITALFQRPKVLAVRGSDSPFVFIWDEDVIAIIIIGVRHSKQGCFNLAGGGALTIQQIAKQLHKPLLVLPAWLLRLALWLGKTLKLSRYGPEQLDFLRYRPVLSNRALIEEFGYTPQKTSAEVFAYYLEHNNEHQQNAAEQAK
ncbi:SDR family oxidoreductase [Pseudidiomarina taiwanensis]|uniref:Epimerase n=1 Tax=Pseudidiomarina taiwanensis TaxID=337250 RepID=A0A432ZEU3_9GAMM|nr:SDR family oxidoreductase [Pseudidiomarina taiwanensis]RUO76419.1 epimerase [Pseudidiomarina taiwanensis]